jgi:hypothetical protein
MFRWYYRSDLVPYSGSDWKKGELLQSRDEKVLADYGWTRGEYGGHISKYMRISAGSL